MRADSPDQADLCHLLTAEQYATRKFAQAEALRSVSVVARIVAPTAWIRGRIKSIESTVLKMRAKHLDLEQILDSVAVRVIVPSRTECYQFIQQIHARLFVMEGEFDDYIETPKSNGYQSLHTTLLGPRGQPVEVQVRTQTMHALAEHGPAAHWLYKEQIAILGGSAG